MLKDGAIVDVDSISLESVGRHVYQIFASSSARQSWLADQAHLSDAG